MEKVVRAVIDRHVLNEGDSLSEEWWSMSWLDQIGRKGDEWERRMDEWHSRSVAAGMEPLW